jgi:hypothetical protein
VGAMLYGDEENKNPREIFSAGTKDSRKKFETRGFGKFIAIAPNRFKLHGIDFSMACLALLG